MTGDRWEWATVTALSPVRVRVDNDSAALDAVPSTLVADLGVGQRVYVHLPVGRRPVIIGRAGG